MNPPLITIPPLPPQTYLHHTTLQPRPKLILLGDSITEQASSHPNGWGSSLSIRYNRRCDVMNRGMNGYTSRMGREVLPWILEEILGKKLEERSCEVDADNGNGTSDQETCGRKNETEQPPSETTITQSIPQYTFLIGYGANDSCLPHGTCSRHHVPLKEYSSNLQQMMKMIYTWNTTSTSVVLLTPPPCDTNIQGDGRHNENVTVLYAREVIKLGKDWNVPVVNVWDGMQLPIQNNNHSISSQDYGNAWKTEYLNDGLHFTPMGNYRMFELIVEVLEKDIGLSVEKIPRQFLDHSLVDAEFPEKSFGVGT